jgi:SAM-dependent methyltransferase
MPAFPDKPDPRVYEWLGELPRELFPPEKVKTVLFVERYGAAWALELAARLDLAPLLAQGASADEILATHGFLPSFAPALGWVLNGLAEQEATGLVLPESRLAALRAEALAHEPALAASLDLLDLAGKAYESAATNERAGEEALLGPAGIQAWGRYFANDNPVYAFNNAITALAAANRLPTGGGARVLEVGAGGGSGTEAFLAELARRDRLGDLGRYRVTEPSPFFRRRSQRALTAAWPGAPLHFEDLDIDRPWHEQGTAPGSVDLILAVNVLHVAKDLVAACRQAHESLAPGGWLVLGECLRPFPGQQIAAEMVFQLLPSFRQVELDPECRPHAGFLTPESWRRALERAGFATVEVVPELERIREVFPWFFTGAICARRAV